MIDIEISKEGFVDIDGNIGGILGGVFILENDYKLLL